MRVPASPAQFQRSPAPGSRPPGFPAARASAPQSRPPAEANLRSRPARPPAPSAGQARGRGSKRRTTPAARRVRGTAAATPTACAVTAPAAEARRACRCSRQFGPAPAGPGSQTSACARTTCRAIRPAPDERPAGAAREPAGMRALPESGPHAGGVGALDLLQDALMLRDVAYALAALRHLGWQLGSRRGAPPGGRAAGASGARPELEGRGEGRGGRGDRGARAQRHVPGPRGCADGEDARRVPSRSAPPLAPAAACDQPAFNAVNLHPCSLWARPAAAASSHPQPAGKATEKYNQET